MKKLLTILLICISINTYSETSKEEKDKIIKEQSDGIPGQSIDTSNSGELTVKEVYNDVKDQGSNIQKTLKSLASSLKVTVDKVWDILVKQQLVYSIAYLIGMILTLFSWFHFYYRINQGNKNTREKYSGYKVWRDSDTAVCIISGTMALIGTIVSIVHFQSMLTGFINPEYGAIETILKTAQKLKNNY
jgi:hypothetical protein